MTIYTTPEAFIDPTPSVGESLGTAIGTGLSSGLQLLAQDRLKRMQQERLQNLLSGLGGTPTEGPQVGETRGAPQKPLSDRDILAISAEDPNLGRLLQSQKESAGREVASKFKETKETRKEVVAQARGARENDIRLDRMEKLNEEDKLISPLFNALLQKSGLDIAALKNPDSQEFEKLSNDMFRNIREIFGARINVIEIQTFLKTIPTLMQSKEGKSRVIRNLKLLNRAPELRRKAMKEIIKESGGTPPYDLGEQIEERVSPELDQLSTEFVKGAQIEARETSSFETLPSAQDFKGKTMLDDVTGKRYRSNGRKWKEIR